jgi:RHS repeat-associated protein
MLNDGSHTYTYNAEEQTSTGAGVTYYYDGDGKRVRKSTGTLYWYGMGSDALDETDASGNLPNEYIFFGGKRTARRDSSGNIFYYFADQIGTSRAIVQAGQTTPCYDQDFYPYGREIPHGSEIPAFVNTCPQNYKFTGKERDSESGLDNFGARYNSSQYGRFMTPDPIWVKDDRLIDPQRLNLYAYGRNNPLKFTDPTGMDVTMGNCPGDMTTTMCEAAVRNGLRKEDREHVHFVEGNGKNGYKKGETGVTVDAGYKSTSGDFQMLQSLAGDHSGTARIDVYNPTDSFDIKINVSYNARSGYKAGIVGMSGGNLNDPSENGIGGYTFFPYPKGPGPWSTGSFSDAVVNTSGSVGVTGAIYHELMHVFLGDFGRSVPNALHSQPGQPQNNADVKTKAAEDEALQNQGSQ